MAELITEKTDKDFVWKSKKIDVDLPRVDFQLDALQNELIIRYLRNDRNFLRAFHTNYSGLFFQFLKDKTRLNEPFSISVMGQTRSSKSTSSITIAGLAMESRNKLMDVKHICCQTKDSNIFMADGTWKKIDEIKIGDEVISPQKDGKIIFSKVIKTFKGISDTFKIFDKYKPYYFFSCSPNHKIPFYYKNHNLGWTIKEYEIEHFSKFSKNHIICECISAMTTPLIKFFKNRQNPKIDAYSLGVYIGDGCFTSKRRIVKNYYCKNKNKKPFYYNRLARNLSISSCDFEIIERISKKYPIMTINQCISSQKTKRYYFSIDGDFSKELQRLGLEGKKSRDKFIPKECLYADSEYRKELLAGLIDTDGHNNKHGYTIITISYKLANDIKFLVHSLGGYCNITKRKPYINNLGKQEGEYRIIFFPPMKLPVQIERKKIKNPKNNYKIHNNKVKIKAIFSEKDEVFGITIDSPSQWYITNNFILSHNSDEYEFLENLKNPKITHFGDVFVIDESKQAVFGTGSTAKKVKLMDIQNIIAVNNISTLWLKPDGWSYEGSMYGLRSFGRGQFYTDGTPLSMRINRFMLYNLQESSAGGSLPLGMVYVPHFADILQNGKKLWDEYTKKKQDWVNAEQGGRADTLQEQMFRIAEKIFKYPKFQELKGAQRKTFIATALGSETTKGEIDQIYNVIRLIERGMTYEEITQFIKR